MTVPILLADINVENTVRESSSRSGVSGTLVVLSILLLVALWFAASAVKSGLRRHRRHLRHRHSQLASSTGTTTIYYKDYPPGLRRRSRRHSQVFSLNPTLAEMGGLPPIRTNHQSPSVA